MNDLSTLRQRRMPNHRRHWSLALALAFIGVGCAPVEGDETEVAVEFSGGHDTDPQDHGRPVVLVAAGLGVKPDVFREAFRGVTPAKNGKPSGDQARRNKEALLKGLSPHGVTNDRLDEVSDYYRYRPQDDELWANTPAEAHAIVEDGRIKRIVITSPGTGYSSSPRATIPKFPKTRLKVKLHFDQDLEKNGSIEAIDVESAKPAAAK